ncbi:MAG: hypothetical protein IIB77_09780 [Proteobacteria bacterium]|nr:hypothetical protein [Pseudomonadota bacterium]
MKNRKFTVVVTIAAALYWVAESLIHIFVFQDPDFAFLPTDIDELWMRLDIVVLMIIFGIYADIQTGRLLAKEQEKREVYIATVSSTQHILNNLLIVNFYLLQLEKEKPTTNLSQRAWIYLKKLMQKEKTLL